MHDDYYKGYLDAILYIQADQDVEANKDKTPTITVRAPKQTIDNEPFDYVQFSHVLNEVDDGGIVYILLTDDNGEDYFEVASTEGYQGLPEGWDNHTSGLIDDRG